MRPKFPLFGSVAGQAKKVSVEKKDTYLPTFSFINYKTPLAKIRSGVAVMYCLLVKIYMNASFIPELM